jgi:hypothetical protein
MEMKAMSPPPSMSSVLGAARRSVLPIALI